MCVFVSVCESLSYWATPGEFTSKELFSDKCFRCEQSPLDRQSDCLSHMMLLTWGSSGKRITRSFLEQSKLISGGGSSSTETEGQTQQKKVRGSPALMSESHDALYQSDAPLRFSLSKGTGIYKLTVQQDQNVWLEVLNAETSYDAAEAIQRSFAVM